MEEEEKRKLEKEQRKKEAERIQVLESAHAELALKLQRQQQQIDSLSQERRSQQRPQLADDPTLDSTVPSMPRSTVGSAPGEALLERYPMDDIMENINCELHFKMKNISMKVANVVAFTITPGATFHCAPIQRAMLVSWLMRWWAHIRG